MTAGKPGGIDRVIDVSFYSQGFPGLKVHVAGLSLQAFMVLA